jgi:NAD(P)-dependent dehydrogenase (short-subunit alcohol dehydrogenase family)
MADRRPVAIVTGGTRGIGLGIARAMAADGWDLAITGLRPPTAVADVRDRIAALGVRVHYIASDVAVAADRHRLLGEVNAALGPPSILVNNAGRAPRVRAEVLDTSEESFEELLRTNLQGPYFLTQAFARQAVAAGPGASRRAIVFITSVSAEMASTTRGEYCVSKAGLAMAVKLFALTLAPLGIAVFEVRPGIIETDMTAAVKDTYDARIAGGLVPARRWGLPDDVGRVVASLLRADCAYATGSVIHVDGGLAIPRL